MEAPVNRLAAGLTNEGWLTGGSGVSGVARVGRAKVGVGATTTNRRWKVGVGLITD